MNRIHKPLMGGGLQSKLLRAAFLAPLFLPFSPLFAQLPPPGAVHALDVGPADHAPFPGLSFPTPAGPDDALSGQADDLTLHLYQWDAGEQLWRTRSHLPGDGWVGDAVSLERPVLFSGSPARLYLGGVAAPPAPLTLRPGLNLVGPRRPGGHPLANWNPNPPETARPASGPLGRLFTLHSLEQARLEPGESEPEWGGGADAPEPGLLLPGNAYWFHSHATAAYTDPGEDDPGADTLPAVVAVVPDPARNRVLVHVATAGGPENNLDLFFQDPGAPWRVWRLDHPAGSGDHFVFEDRDFPLQTLGHRLYQVGDNPGETGEGVSAAYEELIGALPPGHQPPPPLDLGGQVDASGDNTPPGDSTDTGEESPPPPNNRTVRFTVYTPLR